VLTLKASAEGSKEEAEDFCRWLRGILIEEAAPNGVKATVEYTVSEEPANTRPADT
jgi:hypothetical protein